MTSHRISLVPGILAAFLFASRASSQTTRPFYLGADISALAQLEQRGAVYREDGRKTDPIKIFMDHGWTCFRLRIWVNPRGGINGLEYTTALAKRIKAAGGTFILDFHYSDWWADPQKQNKPAAWANLSFDDLVKQSQSYTAEVIKTLKDAGACPDMVQVGNEITGGMLWPDGQVKVPHSTTKIFSGDVQPMKIPATYDDAIQWLHLTRLLNADIAGVRSVTTPDDHVRIIIHIDCGGDWPVTQWYMDHLQAAGVDFDILGQSFYPIYHGTIENLRNELRETIEHYHKDIMVVETGYPARERRLTEAQQKVMTWPMTPEGQKQFLEDVIDAVKSAPEGHGIGVNYWHPETIPGPGTRPSYDPNSTFDADGEPLPAMSVMLN
jgi:arabinogalactan endo-1,4-beta-galactosidase